MNPLFKIPLALLVWPTIGFGISMLSVFLGFWIEKTSDPLGSAIIGSILGFAICIVGLIWSIYTTIKSKKKP
jgi:phosphotransferase system  glucose/maltose/N-acetylglucosamine-specific IIC component